jgi:aryl-alcohol dehydrogenase-like predicted oxidoreductase
VSTTGTAAAAGELAIGELRVNRLGFGAMRLTGPGVWGDPPDREAAQAVLHRAIALGVNFIDTADSYGPEISERLIAETLQPYPPELVIATKGGLVRPTRDRWDADCRPVHLRAALEGSLRRLRVDQIDLYQLHTPDPRVPYEESVGTLADLQAEGKIRYIGVSNVDREQLARAQRVARIVSVQNLYNLGDRRSDDVLAVCEREGLAFIPWFPLAAGPLTEPRGLLAEIAVRHGATPGQVALAWLLRRSPVMLPIPGTTRVAHLAENVAAASLRLTDDELAMLRHTPLAARG